MFSARISKTTLTGEIASTHFSNITGDSYRDDISFLATLRALLMSRISPEQKIRLSISRHTYSRDAYVNTPTKNIIEAFAPLNDDTLYIVNVDKDTETAAALFEKLDGESGFLATYPGFVDAPDITKFVESAIALRIYVNSGTRTTIVIVDRMSLARYHALQMFIPRLVPWLFEGHPLTDEDRELINVFTTRNQSALYEELIERFAQKLDLRELSISHVLTGFGKRTVEQQINTLKRSIEESHRRIHDNQEAYSMLVRDLNDSNIRLSGIMCSLGDDHDAELMDYFRANKTLIPRCTDGSFLRFMVRTYLEFFDSDMFETMASNNNSHFYRDYSVPDGPFKTVGARKKLLFALFGHDSCIRVKTCCEYMLSPTGELRCDSHFDVPADAVDCIPNPHIYHFACLGDHERHIREFLMKGDMISAVEQCVCSARSINLGEGITISRFLGDMFSSTHKILELPDGTSVTPAEAYTWLEAQNEKEKKKEEAHG